MSVVAPDTGEVIEFTGATVPMDRYRDLEQQLAATQDELDGAVKALGRSERQVKGMQAELDDLLDRAADRQTVRTCLEFWARRTGRDGSTELPRAVLKLSTGRARWVRRVLVDYEPRDFCVAVIGLMESGWFVEHGRTDVKHLCTSGGKWDEAKFEEFLRVGRSLVTGEAKP